MVKVFVSPFKAFELRNDSKIERGEISLKKSLIAIALLTLGFGLLISSASYATAPKAGDIPDFRVIAPAGAASVLDLDNYALDNDNYSWIQNTDLNWTVQLNGTVPGATLTSVAPKNILSLASGAAAGDTGSYDFTVTDASAQADTDSSDFVASTAIGLYPALSQDDLLTTSASTPPYTYAQDIVGVTGATVLVHNGTVVASGAGTNWQDVYVKAVYDASQNAAYSPRVTLASGAGSASVAGLSAIINATGQFTLTATTGGLSQPVIVGFKGTNTGWTGVSALVSSALLSARRPAPIQEVSPGYDIDDGFETALGSIAQVGFSGPPHNRSFNRLNGPAKNSWVSNVKSAAAMGGGTYYPSVTVVDNASLPASLQGSGNSFPGDHSGNSLCISLRAAPAGAYIVLNSPVAAQAGYAYAVEASVGSDASSGANAPSVFLGIHSFGFTEVGLTELGPSSGTVAPNPSAPVTGWVKQRSYIEPSAAALADGSPSGLEVTIMVTNASASTLKVYVDNVRIYKTAMPDDLAWGGAKVAIAGRPSMEVGTRVREYCDPSIANALAGQPFYGNFEKASGAIGPNSNFANGNLNGWFHSGTALPTGVTATVDTSAVATRIEAADLNWLTVNFSGAAAGAVATVRSRQLTSASTVGPVFAPGIYVMSLDYQTPSGVGVPACNLSLTDDGFLTFGFFSIAQGTNGAVRRIRVPVSMRDLDKLTYLFNFVSASTSTQTVHIDNVQADLVNDLTEYNDASLFN